MNKAYKLAAKAKLPVSYGGGVEAEILSFTCETPEDEATVLIHKSKQSINNNYPPMVRIHSACITGESFGSLKCDCGYQLQHALEKICTNQYGILIYLNRHEGRGIGLSNKIRAYAIQEQGYNTIDANVKLGFDVDHRDFDAAIFILRYLEVFKVKLMTNNPDKVGALINNGIEVIERMPINGVTNPFNIEYLVTKRNLLGHSLDVHSLDVAEVE